MFTWNVVSKIKLSCNQCKQSRTNLVVLKIKAPQIHSERLINPNYKRQSLYYLNPLISITWKTANTASMKSIVLFLTSIKSLSLEHDFQFPHFLYNMAWKGLWLKNQDGTCLHPFFTISSSLKNVLLITYLLVDKDSRHLKHAVTTISKFKHTHTTSINFSVKVTIFSLLCTLLLVS